MRRNTLVGLFALAPVLMFAACTPPPPAIEPTPAPTTPVPTTPALSSATPATAIPEDFPLEDEMILSDDVRVTLNSVGMRAVAFCGRLPLRGLTVTDRLTAEASGPEHAQTRDLMLFADPQPPAAVLREIRASAGSCAAEPTDPGSRLLTEVAASSLGEDAATILRTYEQDGKVGIGAEIIVVAVVGRALLVTSTYAEWDPTTNLDEGIAEVTGDLEKTVAAMSIFTDPTGSKTARAPALRVDPTSIPDGFPLALRIAENESDGLQPVPASDAKGVGAWRACGQRLWPLAPSRVTDRLAVQATGPEYVDARELVAMRGAQVAVRAVARIRADLATCTTPRRGAVWTMHDAVTGYDSVTFTLSYTRGLGLSAFQVIRVGRGVLITHAYGEGLLSQARGTIRRQTRLGRDLAGSMCVFARAGC